MANAEKIEAVSYLKGKLENYNNFILVSYSGLTVEQMTQLRAKFREERSEMKVFKNNLFLKALKESSKHTDKKIEFGDDYKGPMAAVFSANGLPTVAKICKNFSKDNENLKIKGGYLDGQTLTQKNVEAIAGLPSLPELLSKVAYGLNSPATGIAISLKQIITGVARAIKAVGEKNG